jgi:hypothetical protein
VSNINTVILGSVQWLPHYHFQLLSSGIMS